MAAETNTIISTDLAPEISIDHIDRLNTGVQSLQKLLGVTSLTPMSAGSSVYTYTTSKVNTPKQVGEGETIPLTQYKRVKSSPIELALKKFRKQTTAEAIQRVGDDIAINKTDELLLKDVQKEIKTDLITMLKTGTGKLTTTPTTLQEALAYTWGEMAGHFVDVDTTPVYFVNNLDVAEYLAKATVTVQTQFGFSYIEDFLSLGTVIIDPTITKGTVIGTAKENLNGVYVPAGGDVASQFGLTYDETGLVGMKHYNAETTASVDTLIMSGVTFYPEDKSGIFVGTISAASSGSSGTED